MRQVQDFYKSTITQDWSIGTGNFYVSVKPTITEGWLYISPNNASLREQIYYNGTGTDANGDYITITQRGLGETNEQTHTIGEPIRMNIGEGYVKYLTDAIDDIVAAGAPDADTSTKGLVEEATNAEIIAGTDTGGTGAKLFATPSKLNTQIDAKISAIPAVPLTKLIGVGNSSNTTYENYKLSFTLTTGTSGRGWTSIGSPTYHNEWILTGSAVGVYREIIDMATGAAMTFTNNKTKILEWDARVQADATTGTSFMGFYNGGLDAANIVDIVSSNKNAVGFFTNASGNWFIYNGNGSTSTATSITNPSASKHTFRIEYNPAIPSALFYIDGTLVGTHTTNFPTTSTSNLIFCNGTTSVVIQTLSAPSLAIQK